MNSIRTQKSGRMRRIYARHSYTGEAQDASSIYPHLFHVLSTLINSNMQIMFYFIGTHNSRHLRSVEHTAINSDILCKAHMKAIKSTGRERDAYALECMRVCVCLCLFMCGFEQTTLDCA